MPMVTRLLALIPPSADCVGGIVGVAGMGEGTSVGGTSVTSGTGVLALISKVALAEKTATSASIIVEAVRSILRITTHSCTVYVRQYNFPQLPAVNSESSGRYAAAHGSSWPKRRSPGRL